MTDLIRFCDEFGLNVEAASQALARERAESTSALAMPWFVRLVVGAGAWVTALSAVAVGSVLLFMAIDTDVVGTLAILGAGFLGLGLWLLRKERSGAFAGQLGVAVAAAGVAMIAAGVAMETETLWLGALSTVAVTVLVVMATPNRTLQFLAAALTAVLLAVSLVEEHVPYYLDIAALAGPAGVLLTLRPPRRDLQPVAIVLLLTFPLLGIFGAMNVSAYIDAPEPGGWIARTLHIGLFLWLMALHRQRASTAQQARLKIFALPAVLVCLLLPAGGSAALVVMMLAFVIGSRPLALLGTLLQIHYVWRFYYDLDATLLVKSGVLAAAGAILLLGWWLIVRDSQQGKQL